jgi:hypothetical protein
LLGGDCLFAQSTYATLQGAVRDASGAVIPAARVQVRNVGQNTVSETTTNDLGNYEVHHLIPGEYEVTIEAKSFRPSVHKGVLLNATQVVRVDAHLEVGATLSEVTVVSGVQAVTTESSTIDSARSQKEIMSLPLNYRAGSTSLISFIALAPGVEVRGNSSNFSVAGSRQSQNETSIDGISTIGMRNHDISAEMFPSSEIVREVRVSAVSNGAEYQGSANVDTISRSGENVFHGSLFEYLQNGAFDARNFFSTSVPFKVANSFGGSLGGPLLIPRLYNGRNRTFFFIDYEGNRQAASAVISPTVPTLAMRGGDFSAVRGLTLRDLNGQPFPNNTIPASRLNATSLGLQRFYPSPNYGAADLLSANFRGSFPIHIKSDQFDARLDHHITDRHFVFGRFSFKNGNNGNANFVLPTIPPSREVPHVRTMVFSDSLTLTPRWINEFRAGFSRQKRRLAGPFDGPGIIRELGIQGLSEPLPDRPGFPQISITGFTTLQAIAYDNEFSGTGELMNHMTYMKGAHTMKWGASVRLLRVTNITNVSGAGMFGNFTFANTFTGNAYGDFLLGIPTTDQRITARYRAEGFTRNWNFFWQDDFKITPRLTLNYGLRYEYHPPFRDRFGNISNWDNVNGRVVVPTMGISHTEPVFRATIGSTPIVTAKDAGWPEALRQKDLNNFAPRFGFAFRPSADNRSVIRGGWGIFVNDLIGSVFGSTRNIHTASTETFTNRITDGVPYLRFPNAFPPTIITGVADFRSAVQYDMRNPYTMQWHLTIEREVMRNTGVRLSYIGSHSVGLVQQRDYDQAQPSTQAFSKDRTPYPLWNTIFCRVTGQSAKFHSFQAEFNRRLTSGLTVQSSFTWMKNLTDGSDANEGGSIIENSFDRKREYSNVEYTRPRKWLTTWVWELPFGRGRHWMSNVHRVVDGVLGGWELSGVLMFQDGYWFTPVFSGYDPSNTNATSRVSNLRPDRIASGALPADQRTIDRWFDASAFVAVPRNAGRFGTSAPFILQGPGMAVLNAGLGKRFYFDEKRSLRLMGSFQNLPNHPNFANPATNIASTGSVGRITSTLSTEGAGARTLEISARFEF